MHLCNKRCTISSSPSVQFVGSALCAPSSLSLLFMSDRSVSINATKLQFPQQLRHWRLKLANRAQRPVSQKRLLHVPTRMGGSRGQRSSASQATARPIFIVCNAVLTPICQGQVTAFITGRRHLNKPNCSWLDYTGLTEGVFQSVITGRGTNRTAHI